ncbi:hypothetical protein ABER98_01620 [Domibacillus aminovorans]|uniref:hypothetical protein n=1 Tax=Domibacillus aminovorans TaxID=29332 RepID=UPI003D1BCF9B
MKLQWVLATGILLLAGCGESENQPTEPEPAETEVMKEEAPAKEVTSDATEEETAKEEFISTSVFKFAKGIEYTNAIDINKHVTVFLDMSEELAPGLAVQHVVKQTYDFLQQKDIEGAKTVTIVVNQWGQKIAMYTVQKDQFVPDAEKPMTDAVMEASKIEFMTPEVKEFGKNLGAW